MKTKYLSCIFVLLISGCGTNELSRVATDMLNQEINRTVGVNDIVKDSKNTQSVETNNVSIWSARRTTRDLGIIRVSRTEQNSENKTMIALEGCNHPRTGNLDCEGVLYEINEAGWLQDDKVGISTDSTRATILASAKHYLKLKSKHSDQERYTTGTLDVAPFVTTYVSVVLE